MSGSNAGINETNCLVSFPAMRPQPLDLGLHSRPFAHGVDLKGAYIQGPPGGRFIYLSWGSVDDADRFTLFRRAKLWLDAIPTAVIDEAMEVGLLVGRLGLTDRKGNPLCAAVRPPLIEWSAAAQSDRRADA